MTDNRRLISELQAMLQCIAWSATEAWWERCLRGVIPFGDVGLPEIRRHLAAWLVECGATAWDETAQLALARGVVATGGRPVYAPRNEAWHMRSAMIADPDGNLIEIGAWNKGAGDHGAG